MHRLLLLSCLLSTYVWADILPDLNTLKSSTRIMGPGSSYHEIHKSWEKEVQVMKDVDIYDSVVERMQQLFCSRDQNKSVLLLGEPGQSYRYIFARMAAMKSPVGCDEFWHGDVDINKIEAGHSYVGSVEDYWLKKLLKPAENAKFIMYFANLGQVIGLGSSMHNSNGIEAEMSANIADGRIKVISFMDKYEYNHVLGTERGYVVETYAEKINIPELSAEQVGILLNKYAEIHYPQFKLTDEILQYLLKTIHYYQPNTSEPHRSMVILKNALRKASLDHGSQSYALTKDDIRESIFKVVQIPRWILKQDYSLIKNLRQKLDDDVVGVEEGKRAVMRQAKIGYVAGRTDEKPVGSLLLVGPTGTGKSYLAKKTAEFLELKLITLDMTGYATPASFDRFLDTVAHHLTLNPYAVYLFEEIDKADRAVLDRLYFMMDEGIFYDKKQRPLFARGAMIMMTTNTAKDVILQNHTNANLRSLVMRELQNQYRASFLNRFDALPIFTPFTPDQFNQLAKIMVQKKAEKLRLNFGWNLEVETKVLHYLGKNGQSAEFGARPMERLIENVISIGISEFQMSKRVIKEGETIKIVKLRETHSFRILVGTEAVDFEADQDINAGKFLNIFNYDKDAYLKLFGHDNTVQ